MATQVHTLKLGERIAYQFTLTADSQDTFARFRISNLTLDCEIKSFTNINSDVHTVHICNVSANGGIGDSIACFVTEGGIDLLSEASPKSLPSGYQRMVYQYFPGNSSTASFLSLTPGTYLLVPSAGYGVANETTGLITVGNNAVTLPRDFRFNTFASTESTRKEIITGDNNNMTISFSTRVIEQRRNMINGVINRTVTKTTSYIPIITMGLRKVFRSKTNDSIPTKEVTITTATDNTLYPTKANITNISVSMTTEKDTFGSLGIDYIYSTPGGKHMIGTQKQFVMLNGRIHNDDDTSFNVPLDTALKVIEGQPNVRGTYHVRNGKEYRMLLNDEGYGIMYNYNDSSNFYVTKSSTNIESIIVPFGFMGNTWIAGWDGNIMGIKDNSLTFIHRTGWYAEQDLKNPSPLNFQETSIDSSGVVSAGSIVLASHSHFDTGYRHVYIDDTSLYSDNLGYTQNPDSVSYISIPDVKGYLGCQTSANTVSQYNAFVAGAQPANTKVTLLTPSLDIINTILDTDGHINPEPKYNDINTSQQWVMSNGYNNAFDNSFGYINLINSYGNYDLNVVEIPDEINAADTEVDIYTDWIYVSIGNQYVSQNNILDLTADYIKYNLQSTRGLTLQTGNSSGTYGVEFTMLADTCINCLRVLVSNKDAITADPNNIKAYLKQGEGESEVTLATFHYAYLVTEDQPDSRIIPDITPELVLLLSSDYQLQDTNKYHIILSPSLAALSHNIQQTTITSTVSLESMNSTAVVSGQSLSVPEFYPYTILPAYSFDSLAEGRHFRIAGGLNNTRNTRNRTGELLTDSSVRDMTILSTISNIEGAAFIDVDFDTDFARHDFNHVEPISVAVSVCGTTITNFTYNKSKQKFQSESNNAVEYASAVPIQMRYYSPLDNSTDAIFRFGVSGDPVTLTTSSSYINVADMASVINMALIWNSSEDTDYGVRWVTNTGVVDSYESNIYYNSGDTSLTCFRLNTSAQSLTPQSISLLGDSTGEQSFVFNNVLLNGNGHVKVLFPTTTDARAAWLLFNAKMNDDGVLYIAGLSLEKVVTNIIVDDTSIVFYTDTGFVTGDLHNGNTVAILVKSSIGGSGAVNKRDRHFFTATNCVANNNTLTFTPKDTTYVYDLFTRNMKGSVISHLNPSSNNTSYQDNKYLITDCWYASDGNSSYDWKMSLIPLNSSNTQIHDIVSGSTCHFYLRSTPNTSESLTEDDLSLRLPATMTNDVFTVGYKLVTELPDFKAGSDIIFNINKSLSSVIHDSTPKAITVSKIMSAHEKDYVTSVSSIVNSVSSGNNPILLTLGKRDIIPNPIKSIANATTLFLGGDPGADYPLYFNGYELSIQLTLPLMSGSNLMILQYPGINDSLFFTTGRDGSNYASRIINNSSKQEIQVTEPDDSNISYMKYSNNRDDADIAVWTYKPAAEQGKFTFTFRGANNLTLWPAQYMDPTSAATSPIVTYKATRDASDTPLNYNGVAYVPLIYILNN